MILHGFHNREIRKSRNPKIRKSGNPHPYILQSASPSGGRHEPEALKSAAPVLASQIERMKGNVCQESMQKSSKALKRSFIGPTSCRPPAPPHRISPHLTTTSCPLPMRILHCCTFQKFLHVFVFSKIKLNLLEGVMSAVLRQPSGVILRTLYLMV